MKFKKHDILSDVDDIDTYKARCLLVALMGAFTELRYNFVLSADFQLSHKHKSRTECWYFMFDEEEVTLKQQLRIESQSRSPSPHRHSGYNSPSVSPRHRQQHQRHVSPRLSPRRFRGDPPPPTTETAPFLHSGEAHFLPSASINAPPSYEEAVGYKNHHPTQS